MENVYVGEVDLLVEVNYLIGCDMIWIYELIL